MCVYAENNAEVVGDTGSSEKKPETPVLPVKAEDDSNFTVVTVENLTDGTLTVDFKS